MEEDSRGWKTHTVPLSTPLLIMTMPLTLGRLPAVLFEQVMVQGQHLVHRAPRFPGAGRYCTRTSSGEAAGEGRGSTEAQSQSEAPNLQLRFLNHVKPAAPPDTEQALQSQPFLPHSGHGLWGMWSFEAKTLWTPYPLVPAQLAGKKGFTEKDENASQLLEG